MMNKKMTNPNIDHMKKRSQTNIRPIKKSFRGHHLFTSTAQDSDGRKTNNSR